MKILDIEDKTISLGQDNFFNALHPSQQFFSLVVMDLPGLNQY